LKQHLSDNHAGQWDRFSWFGFCALNNRRKNGYCDLRSMPQNVLGEPKYVITDVEALLIHAMGLENINQPNFRAASDWTQIKSDEITYYESKFASLTKTIGLRSSGHFGKRFCTIQLPASCAAAPVLKPTRTSFFSTGKSYFQNIRLHYKTIFGETYERKTTLEKFEFALLLSEKQGINKGATPYQDVKIVVELRNALVHFKPEWDTQADRHQKLSKKLKSKFRPSPFLNDELIFPRRWATHGCTSWGVRSCLKFAVEFERLSNLPPKYPQPINP
jgi:hypothetical protein